MRKLLLIMGDLATGKSTFANILSKRYDTNVFFKDSIKEVLGDKIGFSNREENKRLSNASMELMFFIFSEFGKLSKNLPSLLVENIKNYLKEYRMINDYIEIKAGNIINLSFDVDVVIDKNYNKNDVISAIISKIEDYMNINHHIMGEEIYVGDLQKEIGKIDGVINLISLNIINEHGDEYSDDLITQETYKEGDEDIVDLEASDWILYNDGNSMMEIKSPDKDIRIRIKER
jgi:hypothetical protein